MFETMTAKNSQKKQGIPAEGGILAGKESVTEKIIYDFVCKRNHSNYTPKFYLFEGFKILPSTDSGEMPKK
jgi:hypothetical protein